ncbi:MAG: hypothetical protein N2689_03320 [Verrucomicrobiae bacterium]|nr:hypothetical protein [Verrucomicrobiae bacterium]
MSAQTKDFPGLHAATRILRHARAVAFLALWAAWRCLAAEPDPLFALWSKLPAECRERIGLGGKPDEKGWVGYNRIHHRWDTAANQRSAMFYLMNAAVRGDAKTAEDGWRAVEAAFAQLQPDGSFNSHYDDGRPARREDCFSDNAFWLSHFCQAALVLRASPLSDQFRERIQKLRPQLRRAADFLMEGRSHLKRADAGAVNRLFIDAVAYGLSGVLLDDETLKTTGKQAADFGLERQREDGVFLEHNGADSSYQAVSIQFLQTFALYFPDKRYDEALSRAARWMLGRILPSGQVDVTGNTRTGLGQERLYGRPKGVNYNHVFMGLGLYGLRAGDAIAVEAAERAFKFYVESRRARSAGKGK